MYIAVLVIAPPAKHVLSLSSGPARLRCRMIPVQLHEYQMQASLRLHAMYCRERHLQNLGSEPLTAPPPPPKRRKTAAAAAKAARAESAPAATAARVAGGSSSDDADGDGSPPQPGASRQAAPDVSTDDADMDDDKQRAGRIRADTLLDAELAVQLAAEPEQSAGPHEGGSAMGGLATARLGSRMDDGAGPSSAPPAEGGGTSDEQDTGPARGARPQRGGGASAAFDALREAKAAAEVRAPSGSRREAIRYSRQWSLTCDCICVSLQGCNCVHRSEFTGLQHLSHLQARSTARASGLPPPAAAAPADDASSDDSDEELVLVPEVGCQRQQLTVHTSRSNADRRGAPCPLCSPSQRLGSTNGPSLL